MEKQYEFEMTSTTPIMMHKFNGQEKAKELKTKTENEQAEAHAYRCKNGNLGVPATWIRGCILGEYIRETPKGKPAKRLEIAPAIRVDPLMIDLNIDEYEIDVRSAPAGSSYRGGCRTFCVRPIIKDWKITGTIITTLPKVELEQKFSDGGKYIGIGSNRPNGYGRFKLSKFRKKV